MLNTFTLQIARFEGKKWVKKLPYTDQAPPLTSEEIESLLKENNIARICSHNKDGTIHAVPVHYKYINGQIVMVFSDSSRKTRNIKRNNDVTVLIDTGRPFRGILIYGKAELGYDNVHQLAVSVHETSGQPREKVERFVHAHLDPAKCVIVKVTPKRIVTFGYA